MNEGRNRYYRIMSEDYTGKVYLILKKFHEHGSRLYLCKNDVEVLHLKYILDLVGSDALQVVTTNSPETYGEYAPYTEIDDLRELILYAMHN
jgi:hypothetical protein